MANTILNNLTSQQLTNNPMLNLLKQMRGAKNPNDLIVTLASQNPQMREVLKMVNQSNKTPKELFYEMAQQKGVDPNEILNLIK